MKTIIYTPAELIRTEYTDSRLLGRMIGTIKGVLRGVDGGYAKIDETTTKFLIQILLEVLDNDSTYSEQNIAEMKELAEKLGFNAVRKHEG
jgi:hypothetical protein